MFRALKGQTLLFKILLNSKGDNHMNEDKWQIANEQVGIFWSTLGIDSKKISKQYPLTIEKFRKLLKHSNIIHLLIEYIENLTSSEVEKYLIAHNLIKSGDKQADNSNVTLAGALYAINDSGIIFIPSNEHEPRKLFSLTHELGHYFIEVMIPFKDSNELNQKRLYNRDAVGGVKRNTDGSLTEDSFIEFKANQFAAELLMPRKMVLTLVPRLQKGKRKKISRETLINRIAKKFGVSTKAAEYRILDLGIDVK